MEEVIGPGSVAVCAILYIVLQSTTFTYYMCNNIFIHNGCIMSTKRLIDGVLTKVHRLKI